MSATPTNPAGDLIFRKRVQLGMSRRELADKAGVSVSALDKAASGFRVTAQIGRKIELILGPIWSAPGEFKRLERAAEFLGIDPILAPVEDLAAAMKKRRVRFDRGLNREGLLCALAFHLHDAATQPTPTHS